MRIMLNITCVCSHGPLTGIERFALHMARELGVVAPATLIVSTERLVDAGGCIVSRALAWFCSLFGRYEYLLRALWDQTWLRRLVARHKPDILFFPIQDGMLFPPVKQIVTVHDLHYLHFERLDDCRQEIPAFRRALFRWKMPHILSRSAAIVTVSESTKQELIRTFDVNPDKVRVIHNGYDDTRFFPIEDPSPVLARLGLTGTGYFLFVGSILKHKNIARLVRAFAALGTGHALVIAGACKDPAYLEELMNAAGAAGREGRVRYLEYVSDDDLPSLYSGALALVLPSLHEGFGVPIIEAMACGTPVITSNYSSMPEVAGEAALLVDPYSIESITSAMQRVIEDPQLVGELREAGLKRIKMFRWSNLAQELYRVCQEVSGS